MSMMLQALAEGGAKVGQAAASIDRLSPEQKNRIKELERQEALGLLGLDRAQQQQILSQQLQPVQAAEREAMQRQSQNQMITDIGQGQAFRGQQALLEGGARARTQATTTAQQQIAELDELARRRQLNELARLKGQQQQNRRAIAQMLTGGAEATAGIVGAKEIAKIGMQERETAMLEAKNMRDLIAQKKLDQQKKITNKSTTKLKNTQETFDALSEFNPQPTLPTPEPEVSTPTPSTTEQQPISQDVLSEIMAQVALGQLGLPVAEPTSTLRKEGINAFNASVIENDPVLTALLGTSNEVVNLEPREVSWGTMTPVTDDTGNVIAYDYISNSGKQGRMSATDLGNTEYATGKPVSLVAPSISEPTLPSVSEPTSTSESFAGKVTLMPREWGEKEAKELGISNTFTHSPGERKTFEVQRISGAGDVYHIISDEVFFVNGKKAEPQPGGRWKVSGLQTTSRLGFELDATKPNQVFEAKSVN